MMYGSFFDLGKQNVLFTLFIGYMMIWALDIISRYQINYSEKLLNRIGATRLNMVLELFVMLAGFGTAYFIKSSYSYAGVMPVSYTHLANTTKFIIISREKIARRNAGLICISFEMPHSSGSLYQMLSHIIYNDLNMTRIESRPLPDKTWEFRFYVEFEGKANQAGVINALSGINAESLNMKILGNY